MKIKKSEFEELIRDSEKLRGVISLALSSEDVYMDRDEVRVICGLQTIVQEEQNGRM